MTGGAVASVSRQPVGAAKHEPVLVPVQLPDDLVVAAGRIQVRDAGPEAQRRAPVVDRVARPVDPLVRAVEAQAGIAEQVELAAEQAVGAGGGLGAGPARRH